MKMYLLLCVICTCMSACGGDSKGDQKTGLPSQIPQSSSMGNSQSSSSWSAAGLSSISSLPNVVSSTSSVVSSSASSDYTAIRLCMGNALENTDFTGYELITHFNICAGSMASSASFEAFSNIYISALATNHFQFSR